MAVTRESFRAHAKPIIITIDGVPLLAEPKEFKTGSLGWFVGGKVPIAVNGDAANVQVGINLTVVKSKDLPQ